MAYSFQDFSVGQVLTAAQMDQVEINIRDHQHGASSVLATGHRFDGPDIRTAGGSVAITINANGELNFPLQSSFSAYNSATDSNVTGADTLYSTVCDTEIFDQNSDYNAGTGVFTAPVAGKYSFSGQCFGTGITVACTYLRVNLVSSNRTWIGNHVTHLVAQGDHAVPFSISDVDMDAGDTAYMQFTAGGEAGDTIDLFGTSSPFTYFAGHLVA